MRDTNFPIEANGNPERRDRNTRSIEPALAITKLGNHALRIRSIDCDSKMTVTRFAHRGFCGKSRHVHIAPPSGQRWLTIGTQPRSPDVEPIPHVPDSTSFHRGYPSWSSELKSLAQTATATEMDTVAPCLYAKATNKSTGR